MSLHLLKNTGVTLLDFFNSSDSKIDTSSLLESLEEIQIRLKFIGRIEVNDKVNVKNLYIQQDGFLTRLARTFYNPDNRKNTLKMVRDVITRTIEIIQQLLLTKDEANVLTCQNILNDLVNARKGIMNLKNTYNDDVMFSCQMETLIQKIDTKLLYYNKIGVLKIDNQPKVLNESSSKSDDDVVEE